MSSDEFIKQQIKEIILAEKIADNRGQGSNIARGIDSIAQTGKTYYAPGKGTFSVGTTSFKDAIKTAVGIVAPTAIMAMKTIGDLGTTALSLGKHMWAGVSAPFTGANAAHRHREIAAQQRAAFIRSNAKAKQRIASWSPTRVGTEGEPATPNTTYWLREQVARSKAYQLALAENAQTDIEVDILSAVDADLSNFLSNVNHAMSAASVSSLVKMGTSALSLDPAEIDVGALEAQAGSNPTESAEVQKRLLPYMKSTVIIASKNALEDNLRYNLNMYRESDLNLDQAVEDTIKRKYENAQLALDQINSTLNISEA